MNAGKVLGWTMAVLSIAAAIGYFCVGDTRRGFYWLFAAGITGTVTW
jgi:nitroreductase